VERQGHSLGLALGQLQRQRQLLEAQAAWRQAADLPVTDQLLLSRQEGEDFAALQEWHQRLILTELLVEAALFRRESRGGHFRSDAPAPQPYWRRHSRQEQGSGIRTSPVRE
jgi:L-aspartate oxidase